MAVLVDTNVIGDVIYQDPVWVGWASAKLSQHAGEMVINPVIYAELCYRATSVGEVDQLVTSFGFKYEEMSKEALFLAAKAFRTYRQRGGAKKAPLSDFFIGAHAEAMGIPF